MNVEDVENMINMWWEADEEDIPGVSRAIAAASQAELAEKDARIKELAERNSILELREKQRCFPGEFGNSCDQETITKCLPI